MFDLVLALRQIYSVERFKPFCTTMEDLTKYLSEKDMEMIREVGDSSRGWLNFIEVLIEDFNNGVKTAEELLISMKKKPERYFFDHEIHLNSFIELWSKHVSDLVSKNTSIITNKSFELSEIESDENIIKFITDTSDRFELVNGNTIKFNIKPDFQVNANEIENIILMPSIFASRKVTFWNNGKDFIFYISVIEEDKGFIEPSDMLILNTLAFNDKTRLKMLKILTRSSQSVNDLAGELNVNPSTISRHMKVFKDTGFVDIQTRDKNTVYYTLNKNELKSALGSIYKYISNEIL